MCLRAVLADIELAIGNLLYPLVGGSLNHINITRPKGRKPNCGIPDRLENDPVKVRFLPPSRPCSRKNNPLLCFPIHKSIWACARRKFGRLNRFDGSFGNEREGLDVGEYRQTRCTAILEVYLQRILVRCLSPSTSLSLARP